MQELERCNEQIKFYTDQLQHAREQQTKLLEILSFQKGGDEPSGKGKADGEGDDDEDGDHLDDLNLDDIETNSNEGSGNDSKKTLSEDRVNGDDED